MADSKISFLTSVPAASGADEFAVNQGSISKKATLTQMAAFLNTSPALTGTPTAPTAAADTNTTQIATTAFVQTGGPVKIKSLSSDATANGNSTAVRVSGMDVTVPSGTYVFEYYVRAHLADAGNSPKFAVNHTGTTTSFCYNFFFPSAGVSAATGAIDQEVNSTTGQVWAFQATRVKNTLLGPETGVDTTNADIIFRISGLMIVTVSGTLELYQGSEVNGNLITIKAGTCLILTKTG